MGARKRQVDDGLVQNVGYRFHECLTGARAAHCFGKAEVLSSTLRFGSVGASPQGLALSKSLNEA